MIHRCQGNSGQGDFALVPISFSNYTNGNVDPTVTGSTFIVTQAMRDLLEPSLPPDQGYEFVVVPEGAVLDLAGIVIEGTGSSIRAGCNAINGEAVSLGNLPYMLIRTSQLNQQIWGIADNAGDQPLMRLVDDFVQIQTDIENPGQPIIIVDGPNQCNALDSVADPVQGDLPPTITIDNAPTYIVVSTAENPFWRAYVQTLISGDYVVKIPYTV